MRIRSQFLLTLLSASLCILLLTSVLMQLSFQRSLDQYFGQRQQALLSDLTSEFADYYNSYGDFDGIALRVLIWNAEGSARRPIPDDLVLMDEHHQPLLGAVFSPEQLTLKAIIVENRTVGWLGLPNNPSARADSEQRFEKRQNRLLLTIAVSALALTLAGAWWLSRTLVRPIEEIARFSRALSAGDYEARLTTTSLQKSLLRKIFPRFKQPDELIQLEQSMNTLAHSLEQNRGSRQRWLADLSHELRTPVTVMRAELEAMQDGIRPLNQQQIGAVANETQHLSKLLDDLHDLSLADAGALRYQMTDVNLSALVDASCSTHRPLLLQNNQQLNLVTPPSPVHINGDATRLKQLLNNLLDNCRKYTDHDSSVTVSLTQTRKTITLTISDTSPGVNDEQLAHLFDHLYRVDSSRNRHHGGAGLGLAICKRIVEAHHGNIIARHHHTDAGRGLTIEMTFYRNAQQTSEQKI